MTPLNMLQLSLYLGLPDGLDLQAKVKRNVLQSIVIGRKDRFIIQGFGQDIQIRERQVDIITGLFGRLTGLL